MRVRVYWAIARGVVLESFRRKDLWVAAILGFLIIGSSSLLSFFGATGLQTFAKDLGVSVLGALSTVIAVMISCRILPEEIKHKTLYPMLARPVSRFDLLAGKLLGAVLTTWAGFALLSLATIAALLTFGVHFEPIWWQYFALKALGLSVVCSVALAFSAAMTPQAAATVTLILAFGSSMISRALVMGFSSQGPATQAVFKLLNALLPQTSLFDIGGRVANDGWSPVPTWAVLWLAVYGACYMLAMLSVGWLRFRKQTV